MLGQEDKNKLFKQSKFNSPLNCYINHSVPTECDGSDRCGRQTPSVSQAPSFLETIICTLSSQNPDTRLQSPIHTRILGHGFNTFSKYFRVHDQDQRKRRRISIAANEEAGQDAVRSEAVKGVWDVNPPLTIMPPTPPKHTHRHTI